MRQTLHLLILDADRRCALVAWHGGRWMLPIVDLPERVRAPSTVPDWMSSRGLHGRVVGQWMGRLARNEEAVDWLVVAYVLNGTGGSPSTTLAWTPLSTLLSSAHVLDYQRWALAAASPAGEEPVTEGPFGHTHWHDEAEQLICHATGRARHEGMLISYRVSSSDVVLEYRAGDARYFLKGLARHRVREATLTMKMYEMAPGAFARTAAFVTRPDGSAWWLMEACPGTPLAEHLTRGASTAVAVAYARVQLQVLSCPSTLSALPVLDLVQLSAWAEGIFEKAQRHEQAGYCRAAVNAACEAIESGGVPRSWIAADLDPSNVLVSGDAIWFIDLDDALLGPAPIGVSTFVRRVRALGLGCADGAHRAYERAWPSSPRIVHSWPACRLLSVVLECSLGWQRLLRKTANGEVYDMIDAARRLTAARLAKACAATEMV